MTNSKPQAATAEEVRRTAARYILHKLGDRLWAGKPVYNEQQEQWTIPIHSLSLPVDVMLEQITLDTHGVVVHAPSRRALKRELQRHQSATLSSTPLPELPDDPQKALEVFARAAKKVE